MSVRALGSADAYTRLMTELANGLHARGKLLTAAVVASGDLAEGVQAPQARPPVEIPVVEAEACSVRGDAWDVAAVVEVRGVLDKILGPLGRRVTEAEPIVAGKLPPSPEMPAGARLDIVAPPIEVSNQYLPVLGKIATFAKDADVPERLSRLPTAEQFFSLLEEKGV